MRMRAGTALVCATAAVGLTAVVMVPVASATSKPPTTRAQEKRQNKGLKKAANQISTAQKDISSLKSSSSSLSSGLSTAQSQIKTLMQIADALPPILTQLGDGLTALKGAVTSINTALQDPTTGLVGLNNARPLIGAVASNAAVSGSEFELVGHLANVPAAGLGAYLLSFVNGAGTPTDVSKRVYELTSPNPAQLGTVFTATNCSNSGVTPLCTALNGGHTDDDATDVLIVTSAPSADFQIAAIAG
jgi:phage-related tail protein